MYVDSTVYARMLSKVEKAKKRWKNIQNHYYRLKYEYARDSLGHCPFIQSSVNIIVDYFLGLKTLKPFLTVVCVICLLTLIFLTKDDSSIVNFSKGNA